MNAGFRFVINVSLWIFLIANAWTLRPMAAESDRHVLIISLDGFPAYLLNDPQAPIPTLRRLATEGTVAEGFLVSTPAVTWPNHTTMITGVGPDKHSVFFNGVLVRPGPGLAVQVDPNRDQSDLIAVPTLFDLLARAGMKTAAINWPCTRNSKTLDANFPDVPNQVDHTTPTLREDLVKNGSLPNQSQQSFNALSLAAKDQVWTDAALHVLRTQKPNLLLFHLLVMDGLHHKYGAQSPAGYAAAALVDNQVRDLLQTLREIELLSRTTVFIVSDHGFAIASKLLQPNVVFRQHRLLEAGPTPIVSRARAQIISEGGIAMVYLTDPATREKDRQKVFQLFRDHEGIADILEPKDFPALRLPNPETNPQMADLILVAKEGYAFSNNAFGEDAVVPITMGVQNVGYHGYLPADPKMHGLFIAWGAGIREGLRTGLVENIHLAPTTAFLLGHSMPNADGRVLKEILIPQPLNPNPPAP